MTSKLKAIETVYNGYRFRSRLEARWAVFFDAVGLEYQYEREGFDLGDLGWYLPDFWLKDWDVWVEIKPTMPTDDEMYKIIMLQHQLMQASDEEDIQKSHALLFVGVPGVPHFNYEFPTRWSLRDGAIVLTPSIFDDECLVSVNAFALRNGGDTFDTWPIHCFQANRDLVIFGNSIIDDVMGEEAFLTPVFPNGFVVRAYMGKGVVYDTQFLKTAYQKARSARFEFGENGSAPASSVQ